MSARVLIYVQHLLGIGHLVRAQRIADAMATHGLQVHLVVGGPPIEGARSASIAVVQLPPLKAGPEGFASLVTADGRPATAADLDARRHFLLATLERVRPDALVIEAFPFGRRQMRFELIPLIVAAKRMRPRPLIACSVRDILQSGRAPERIAETLAHIETDFDAVLVHGDPALAPLEASFPEAARFAATIHYTGVVGPPSSPASTGSDPLVDPPNLIQPSRRGGLTPTANPPDVIVAAGGGAVGYELIETALRAKPATRLADAAWLAVTGPNMPTADRERLTRLGAETGAQVVPFLAGLPQAYRDASVAICQAGYNTVADLLAARCRSVLVPFAAGGETEQTERARRLEQRGLAIVVAEDQLSPERLARAIDAAAGLPPIGSPFRLDGASRTATIVADLIRARSA